MAKEDTPLVERIAADFDKGDGPCMYCPKRDDDCYASPFFGYGVYDAEVMIVAEAPGGNKTIKKADQQANQDRHRRWKNYKETGMKSENKSYKNHLQGIDKLPINAGGLPDRLAEEFSVYFTNSVKCSDIHSSENIPDKYRKLLNGYGKYRCLSHLDRELKDIEPNVVIVLSNSNSKDHLKHLDTMFDFFGLSDKKPDRNTVNKYVHNPDHQPDWSLFSTYYSESYECDVIPSYHFSYGFSGKGNSDEEYCNEMANTVRGLIDV